jgi:hypothetical protein
VLAADARDGAFTATTVTLLSAHQQQVWNLGEIEARLRSEHHLADELLAACSMRSVQRRLP